ncbi:hypothetical protein GCM10022255_103230 [Dactylosporangium darangshiense]|uniref:Uncharacterized protein n=1 Tax=Dactylosporangium darangshiense TaxID=579108 RepID=A0ABP8DSH6_9ACTN
MLAQLPEGAPVVPGHIRELSPRVTEHPQPGALAVPVSSCQDMVGVRANSNVVSPSWRASTPLRGTTRLRHIPRMVTVCPSTMTAIR